MPEKISITQCQQIAQSRGGQCLSKEYINSHTELHWRCAKGHEWDTDWSHIRRDHWCPRCAAEKQGKESNIDIKKCNRMAYLRRGECLSTEYINSRTKLHWKCANGHKWDAVWDSIKQGCWCPRCAAEKRGMGLRDNIKQCIQKAEELGGKCLSTEYLNNRTKLRWRCAQGHEWDAYWGSVNAGHWCPQCARIRIGEMWRGNITSNFRKRKIVGINRCRQVAIQRGGLCLSTKYSNNTTKLHWRCAKGHEWISAWANIQGGRWCPTCARERVNASVAARKTDIEECRRIGVERGYRCLSEKYVGFEIPMRWQCDSCGREWSASWASVKRGSGCPFCRTKVMEGRCAIIFETIFGKPFTKCKPFKKVGSLLELDGYNNELSLAFEYDGIQHRTGRFIGQQNVNPSIFERDSKKDHLCIQHGISLIRVNDLEATPETLVDVIINKLQQKDVSYSKPPDEVMSRLRNPTDIIYKRTYGRPYLDRLRKECEKRGGQLKTEVWIDYNYNYIIICQNGHRFKSSYSRIVDGQHWCPACAGQAPIGIDRCKEYAKSRNGECLSDKYLGAFVKLRWRCNKHNYEWSAVPSSVVSRGHWCQKCGRESFRKKRMGHTVSTETREKLSNLLRRRVISEDVRKKISATNKGRVMPIETRIKLSNSKKNVRGLEQCKQTALERDGECLSKEYVNSYAPMLWHCNKHNFNWTACAKSVLYNASWCPKCGHEKVWAKRKLNQKEKAG